MFRNIRALAVMAGLLATGFMGFVCLAADAPTPIKTEDYKEPIRVACVGDSITFGAGVEKRELNSYPVVLGKLLGDKWQVKNFGVSGATMLKNGDKPYNKQKAYAAALEFKPNVLVLKLGTNDSKPQNWKNKADFGADAKALVAEFQKVDPKIKVYVCLPVPAYPGNWGISDQIIKDEIIPILKGVAKDTSASVIDLYAALSDKKELFPDKVHPNAKGAALIAASVFQALTGKETAASQPAATK